MIHSLSLIGSFIVIKSFLWIVHVIQQFEQFAIDSVMCPFIVEVLV